MTLKLYGTTGSPNVRGAMLGLFEKGLDYEFVDVVPPFKDPAHMARNPLGRVPVFEDDGFMLYETQAILRYLDEVYPGPRLQPSEPRALARMNQIIGIIDCYLFKAWSGDIAFERLVAPRFFGRPADEAAIAAALPVARSSALALEGLVVGPYLTGDVFSLADIRLMPHFHWFRFTPEGAAILADTPKLNAWFAGVEGRESAMRVLQ
jgi:glutathione S-transferase